MPETRKNLIRRISADKRRTDAKRSSARAGMRRLRARGYLLRDWSLEEICRVVGLSLSPESSLDPRRWMRYQLPWDGWFYDR